MAMVAHGYGFAAVGSPNLLFSNVIWGYIVRALQGESGLQGYSIATLGALVVSGSAFLYFLARLEVSHLLAIPAVALVLGWPILFPQFTVNAGLLTVAAVLGLVTYVRKQDYLALLAGSILALLGCLIRPLEFLFVAFVSLPFFPWKRLIGDRPLQISCAGILVLAGLAQLADWSAYRSEEWQNFRQNNLARAPYTDFGAAKLLNKRPDILSKYGYSANDIDLIANWFFADPKLTNPKSLNGMLDALGANLGPIAISGLNMRSGMEALGQMFTPQLLSLSVAALVLQLMVRRPQLAVAWVLFLCAVFGLGLLGASAHIRVIAPIIAALLLLALTFPLPFRPASRWIVAALLLVAIVDNARLLLPKASASRKTIASAQSGIALLSGQLIFVWGGALDFQHTYPVSLTVDQQSIGPRLFALGVMTFAPFSVAVGETRAGRGQLSDWSPWKAWPSSPSTRPFQCCGRTAQSIWVQV